MISIDVPVEEFVVTSADGTRIQAYRCGAGPHKWLLPPGMGTPLSCWKFLFEFFHDKMTIVTWEPRGCYRSEKPRDIERLAVDDHVEDALAVVRGAGWDRERFVTGGWSMGVELGLEIYHHLPRNVQGLVLINGAFEHVLRTAFGLPKADVMFRALAEGLYRAGPLFAALPGWLLTQPWSIGVIKSLRLVTANDAFFAEVAQDFKDLDFPTYFLMIKRLDEHSARPILTTVRVPTLITAGAADKMTPLSVSAEMHRDIDGSELFVIPNGTHYATLEYPEIVNLRLDHFFRRRVFAATWDAPAAGGRSAGAA